MSDGGNGYLASWNAPEIRRDLLAGRRTEAQLYPSERVLLDRLRPGMSILDYGCGAGGFFEIVAGRLLQFSYTGIDANPFLVAAAAERYPAGRFLTAGGGRLDVPDGSFDLVFSFGTLHLNLDWRGLLDELWRVTRERLLFDVRLRNEPGHLEDLDRSRQSVGRDPESGQELTVPYVILNRTEFERFLAARRPAPARRSITGYEHPVAPTVTSPHRTVFMGMIELVKGADAGGGADPR